MIIPGHNNQRIRHPIILHDMHIYLAPPSFIYPSQSKLVHTLSVTVTNASPETVSRTINREHQHTCGPATFPDNEILLQRNNIWSTVVEYQTLKTFFICTNCRVTSKPQPSRKVFLCSLNRELNNVVYIDHFFLDVQTLVHVMDATTRYSAALIMPNTLLKSAIMAVGTVWFGQFWSPTTVLGDDAFNHD